MLFAVRACVQCNDSVRPVVSSDCRLGPVRCKPRDMASMSDWVQSRRSGSPRLVRFAPDSCRDGCGAANRRDVPLPMQTPVPQKIWCCDQHTCRYYLGLCLRVEYGHSVVAEHLMPDALRSLKQPHGRTDFRYSKEIEQQFQIRSCCSPSNWHVACLG